MWKNYINHSASKKNILISSLGNRGSENTIILPLLLLENQAWSVYSVLGPTKRERESVHDRLTLAKALKILRKQGKHFKNMLNKLETIVTKKESETMLLVFWIKEMVGPKLTIF